MLEQIYSPLFQSRVVRYYTQKFVYLWDAHLEINRTLMSQFKRSQTTLDVSIHIASLLRTIFFVMSLGELMQAHYETSFLGMLEYKYRKLAKYSSRPWEWSFWWKAGA